MKNMLTSLAVAASVLAGASAVAQEIQMGDFYVGVGISYRNFPQVKFKAPYTPHMQGYSFDAPGADITTIAGYVESKNIAGDIVEDARAVAPYKPGDGSPVLQKYYTFDRPSMNGSQKGSFNDEEKVAPMITVGLPLMQIDKLRLDVIGNFQYFNMDAHKRTAISGTGRYYENSLVYMNSDSYSKAHFVPVDPDAAGLWKDAPFTYDYGRISYDLKLYVFDLGVKGNYFFTDKFAAIGALGPVMYLADSSASLAHDDSDRFDVIFGTYISLGAEYYFNERISASLSFRYDQAFRKVVTRYTSLILDTFSTQARVTYQF